MKILLSAFECEPGKGSEAGVGWGFAWALAKKHRVHVLTTPRHRAAIERFLAKQPCSQLSFSYFDFPPYLLGLVINSPLWQLYYHLWQLRIGVWARHVGSIFDPDVVHHVTYGRYWTPCPLWKLRKPFVWGPLGGGDFCPPPFLAELSRREKFVEKLRSLAQRVAEFDPQLRATARHSSVAIASTPATARKLETLGAKRVIPLLQMALETDFTPPSFVARSDVTFCCVGRLLGWKAHQLALRALAASDVNHAKLLIVGDGPERNSLVKLATELGLAERVIFLGAVSRQEALRHLGQTTALIHPSLHDQAPTVVFEAMAMRTPVIALALGGLPLQVSAETGFLVSAETPAQSVAEIAVAMRRLASEPGLKERLGENARRRVAESFTWDKKAEQFDEIYRTLRRARSTRRAEIALAVSTS